MDPPHILVAHPLTAAAEAIAALLAELRPHFAIRLVAPPDLDAALTDGPAPIVICAEPTLPVQERARGWIALLPAGQDVALVGAGDEWRGLRPPSFPVRGPAPHDPLAPPRAPPPPGPPPARGTCHP